MPKSHSLHNSQLDMLRLPRIYDWWGVHFPHDFHLRTREEELRSLSEYLFTRGSPETEGGFNCRPNTYFEVSWGDDLVARSGEIRDCMVYRFLYTPSTTSNDS